MITERRGVTVYLECFLYYLNLLATSVDLQMKDNLNEEENKIEEGRVD